MATPAHINTQLSAASQLASKLHIDLTKFTGDGTFLRSNESHPSVMVTLVGDLGQIDTVLKDLRSKYTDYQKRISENAPTERMEMYEHVATSSLNTLRAVELYIRKCRTWSGQVGFYGRGGMVWQTFNIHQAVGECYSFVTTASMRLLEVMVVSVSEGVSIAEIKTLTDDAMQLLDQVESRGIPGRLKDIHSELRRCAQAASIHAIDVRGAWYADYVEVNGGRLPAKRPVVGFEMDHDAHRVHLVIKLENESVLRFQVTQDTKASTDDDGLLSSYSCLNIGSVRTVEDGPCGPSTKFRYHRVRVGFNVGFFYGKPPSEEMLEEFNLILLLPHNWRPNILEL